MSGKPEDLNEAQWQAVCHSGGHLLIVAGPGTGKTHTLVRRIARQTQALNPSERILAITFTNKAALQMRQRLGLLGVGQQQVFAGTFHAFCLQLLRQYWDRTSLPKDFKVALPDDIQTLGFKKEILEKISLAKATQLVLQPDDDYKAYQKALRQNSWIDFDDILREALVLLEEDAVAREIKRMYKEVFVDEYQDINPIQKAFLKLWSADGARLTAIGDPRQSIYGFRGSDVSLFHRFARDFPGARTLHLNENYRSCANLLAASGQVIDGRQRNPTAVNEGPSQDEKFELIARMYGEGKLVIHQASTDRAEADYIAAQIEKLVGGMHMTMARGAQCSFGDIAVLYRLNAQRQAIIQALEHLGIPYQVCARPARAQVYSDAAALGQYEETLEYQVEKVSLLTLHAAKGLEFPVVFIAGCEERLLPLDVAEMRSDPQEERRLFYVGMTRARQQLYLSSAGRRQLYGQTLFHGPSPFLSDIEEELKAYEVNRRREKAEKAAAAEKAQLKLF